MTVQYTNMTGRPHAGHCTGPHIHRTTPAPRPSDRVPSRPFIVLPPTSPDPGGACYSHCSIYIKNHAYFLSLFPTATPTAVTTQKKPWRPCLTAGIVAYSPLYTMDPLKKTWVDKSLAIEPLSAKKKVKKEVPA